MHKLLEISSYIIYKIWTNLAHKICKLIYKSKYNYATFDCIYICSKIFYQLFLNSVISVSVISLISDSKNVM